MGTTGASIDVQDIQALEVESASLVETSQAISIVTHEDYLSAGEHSKSLHRAMKQVELLFKEPIESAHQAHKSICAAKNKLFDPLKAAKLLCDDKVRVYLQALRRREAEEAEARRKQMEAQAASVAAESKVQKIAATLKDQGFEEEAAALMAGIKSPSSVEPVKPVEQAAKVEGLHLRSVWKAEVFDPMALIQEIAAGRQPLHLINFNEQALNKIASALRGEMRIPGVRPVEQTSVVNRL